METDWTSSGAWLVALLLLVVLGIAMGVLLRIQRRQQAQLRSLLARLDELEVEPRGDPGGGAETPFEAEDELPAASGDVLHGRSSLVRRVVGGEARPADLGLQAIARVHRRLDEPMSPARLAEDLHVSLRTLERGVARSLDCTPRQLILALKMREARRLLGTGRYRVAEVSRRLAFSDPAHFSRRFKAFYHVPPSELIRSEGE